MMLLRTGPTDARATMVLAHGAGAPADTPFMNAFANGFAVRGLQTIRFEFAYMAARRTGEGRKPPPRADRVIGEYRDVIAALIEKPLFVGGKSMGGRVASMLADELFGVGRIAGLICLGYPFHPPAQPQQVRTAHLAGLRTPTLICQGTRDPFGTRDEVAAYALSPAIRFHWLEDGDHDFRPRKESGLRHRENLGEAVEAAADWIEERLRGYLSRRVSRVRRQARAAR